MGTYANVKYRKLAGGLLRWLASKENVEVLTGGKHVIVVRHAFAERPFPIPKLGNEVNKHIIASFQKWLEKLGVCSKEEFDERL
ncbi:MAG: hypothetical protein WCV85_01995 [Patescibacteria group bacterium]|jgi:BMFP domain-containing protein YqiC